MHKCLSSLRCLKSCGDNNLAALRHWMSTRVIGIESFWGAPARQIANRVLYTPFDCKYLHPPQYID